MKTSNARRGFYAEPTRGTRFTLSNGKRSWRRASAPVPNRLKELARLQCDWEVFREADLQILKVDYSQELFERLYFGTPYPMFRERILEELQGSSVTLPECAILGDRPTRYLEINTGEVDGRAWTKPGGKIHQVLAALSKDFYEPMNIGQLFTELFPLDYFDIFSSGFRVRQLLYRTRTALKSAGLPLEIVEERHRYRLVLPAGFGLRLRRDMPEVDWYQIRLNKLRDSVPGERWLSRKEIMNQMKFTRAEYDRFLATALQRREVERTGNGSGTRYLLLPSQDKKAPELIGDPAVGVAS